MRIKRIVVAIDASPTSLAALEATAELAARWDAEVLGIFVEDTDLLRMATLPFAGEVGSHSGSFRAIDPADIKRQFRSQSERARQAFERTAQRLRIRSSFAVAQGTVKEQLLAALRDADLLSLGKGGRSLAAHLGLGSTARAIASAARGSVLIHSHIRRIKGPVAVVYDGAVGGERGLATALAFTRGNWRGVVVLCVAATKEDARELAEQADRLATEEGLTTECRHLTPADAGRLVRLARLHGADAMIVPAHSPILPDAAIEAVITGFSGPVVVAGGSDD